MNENEQRCTVRSRKLINGLEVREGVERARQIPSSTPHQVTLHPRLPYASWGSIVQYNPRQFHARSLCNFDSIIQILGLQKPNIWGEISKQLAITRI